MVGLWSVPTPAFLLPFLFGADTAALLGYSDTMSFSEMLAELPALSVAERQLLVRRALDLDEPALSAEDEALVEQRLAEHQRNPESAVPLDDMKARLRGRFTP